MPYIARCYDATTGEQVTPDGETFETFAAALESLIEDMLDESLPEDDHDSALAAASYQDGYRFEVAHLDGVSRYRCAVVLAERDSDAVVRDDVEALAYLHYDGGAVPCSRYGDAAACADVALVAARIHASASGERLTFRMLDAAMGDAVNDADGLADLLADHASDADLDALGLDRLDVQRDHGVGA